MVIGDVTYDLLCLITNTRDECLTKYDYYMMIGDVTYDLLCLITNTRDKWLTKYDNYKAIGQSDIYHGYW
jgi:aminoglycoside/choline kinase family phosphotransferase